MVWTQCTVKEVVVKLLNWVLYTLPTQAAYFSIQIAKIFQWLKVYSSVKHEFIHWLQHSLCVISDFSLASPGAPGGFVSRRQVRMSLLYYTHMPVGLNTNRPHPQSTPPPCPPTAIICFIWWVNTTILEIRKWKREGTGERDGEGEGENEQSQGPKPSGDCPVPFRQ
jgi:hypothetical protein